MKSKTESYTLTSQNMRFPTFYDKEYEEEIKLPVTLSSFQQDVTQFQEIITSLEEAYFNLLKEDLHQFAKLIRENQRVPLSYIFRLKELRRMMDIVLSKVKLQFGEEAPIITQYQSQSYDDIITLFINDETMPIANLLEDNYPDKSAIKELLIWHLNKEDKVLKAQNHKTGLSLLSNIVKYSKIVLNEMKEQINLFREIKDFYVKDKKQKLRHYIIILDLIIKFDNLTTISISLHNGYFVDENDLCNQEEDSPTWRRMKKIMVKVVSPNEEELLKEIHDVNAQYPIFGAISAKGFKSKNNFNNFFTALYTITHYKNNIEEALYDYKKTVIDVNDRSFAKMCNLFRIGFMKAYSSASLPNINYRQKFYIKREEKEITLDYIIEVLDFIKKNPDTSITLPNNNSSNSVIISNEKSSKAYNELYYEKVPKEQKPRFISTRLLHSSPIITKKETYNPFFNMFGKINPNETKDSLIIYIHGGGFIGGTTFSNELYAREWVNQLKIPLIGIDYGLSPQHVYPKAIDDAWQAYHWILKHAKDEWRIDPKHIILTGDSAGASISLSLVYLLIIHKIRLPDMLILNYPAGDTDLDSMTNSQLMVYKAPLLHLKFLTYCIESYVGSYQNKNDFILNQFRAPKEIMAKLPPTRFLIGSADVLRDQSLRIIEKISELNIDCKAYEFKELGHGFFNWNKQLILCNPMHFFIKNVNEALGLKLPKINK